jgi:hypothetical protein
MKTALKKIVDSYMSPVWATKMPVGFGKSRAKHSKKGHSTQYGWWCLWSVETRGI